jgi:hypothetical protein
MAGSKITFDTVREIALKLPGVEAGLTYGAGAVKVHGKLLACVPTNKSAEPNSLALPMDPEDRAELIAAAPDIYYAPEHYISYPMVLVRLARVDRGVLRDLLGMAHRFVVSRPKHKRTRKRAE